MHLLTLKRLTLHFTNPLVNVALKFYAVRITYAISTFKIRNSESSSLLNLRHLYFLIFLVKIWCENSISIQIHHGIICFSVSLFDGAAYQAGKEAEAGRGSLMSNLCLMSHRWYDVEKLTVPGSTNLNLSFSGALQKVLC